MPRTIDTAITTSVTVAARDSLTVTASGSITRPGDVLPSAFFCIDAGHLASITIDGYVANPGENGIAVKSLSAVLTIGADAEIVGGETAIFAGGGVATNNIINNSGLLSGGRSGIAGNYGTYTITNSGIVERTATAYGSAAISISNENSKLNLTNSGFINGVNAGNGADFIINTGRIEGDEGFAIIMGGGDDTYDGRNGGVVVGRISLGSGNDTLYGGSGADHIDGGSDADVLEGGGGDDVYYYYDPLDTITEAAGGGIDTVLTLQDITALAANVENIEAIDPVWTQASELVLVGNDGANSIKASRRNDTLTGGKGNDTLDGGSGDDMAVFSGPRSNYRIDNNADGTTSVTDLVGQDGTDLLKSIRYMKFAGETSVLNHAPSDLMLSSTRVPENAPARTEVGRLSALDAEGDSLTYSIVSDPDGAFAVEGRYLVLARPLNYEAKAQHQVTVKAKDQYGGETSRTFTITVTDEVEMVPNFLMRGTPKADRLAGQEGNDTLYGAAGNDMLTGGAGKDIFVFDTKPNKKTNLDVIADYSVSDDTIWLDNKYLKKLGKGSEASPGKLNKKFFKVADKAKDKDDYLVYNKKTGILYYDADGSGAGKAVEIAKLAKNLKLTAADFFVI